MGDCIEIWCIRYYACCQGQAFSRYEKILSLSLTVEHLKVLTVEPCLPWCLLGGGLMVSMVEPAYASSTTVSSVLTQPHPYDGWASKSLTIGMVSPYRASPWQSSVLWWRPVGRATQVPLPLVEPCRGHPLLISRAPLPVLDAYWVVGGGRATQVPLDGGLNSRAMAALTVERSLPHPAGGILSC